MWHINFRNFELIDSCRRRLVIFHHRKYLTQAKTGKREISVTE